MTERRPEDMKTTFSRLKPSTLSTQIGQSIQEAIMRGALKPGERINVRKLALQFRVSHIPVREALKRLEATGVIASEPNKGALVPELSIEDVKKIIEIRKALEGLAAYLAAQRINPQTSRKLQSLVKRMRTAAKAKDLFKLFDADNQFHRTLWELSGNPFLIKTLSALLLPYFGFVAGKGYHAHRQDLTYVPQVHQEILDAVSSGDSDRARDAILIVHSKSIDWLPIKPSPALEPSLAVARK